MMGRFDLTDKKWQRIEPIGPSGRGRKRHFSGTRRFVKLPRFVPAESRDLWRVDGEELGERQLAESVIVCF